MIKDGSGTNAYWNNFIAGDKEAFAHLYNMHVEALYHYGTRLCNDNNLVKDSLQDVFLDLYLKRNKNKVNPENLRFYLILSLKHNLIKKLKKSRKLIDAKQCELVFEPEYSIETVIIEDEREAEINARLKDLLKSLPPGQKEALYLRYNEAMEYHDIAVIMNISVESVRKQVYRAIHSIREQMSKRTIILYMEFLNKLKKFH